MTERRFRWLLKILPGAFREEYERELLQTWRDERRDAGDAEAAGVWRRALRDTVRTAPREYAGTWLGNVAVAARTLRKTPAFTLAAVLTLALGTGTAAAAFSLIHNVLLRPFDWNRPEGVGLVWAITPAGNRTWLSAPELEDIRRDIHSLTSVAGFTDMRFAHTGASAATEVEALAVSHTFFTVLGILPSLGRTFAPEDDTSGAARTVMLSHHYWRAQFGAEPDVIGRPMRLNEETYTIIGVVPASFEWLPPNSVLPDEVDVWVALEPHLVTRDRSVRMLHAVARVRDDATFQRVTSELESLGARAQQQFATVYTGGTWTFGVVPFAEQVLGESRTPLYVAFGLGLLVLVMACTNVTNLLLARAERRRADLVVRSALGAGPARLAGELLAEAFVLAAVGSAGGLAIAAAVPRVMHAVDAQALPRLDRVTIDGTVALMMIALTAIVTALVTFVPLIERLRVRGTSHQFADRSGSRSPAAVRLGRGLVVVQTMLAATVVIAAVFLAETFVRLQRVDIGLDSSRLLTARLNLFTPAPGLTAAQYFQSVVTAAGTAPGVTAAAAVSQLPLSGAMLGSTMLAGSPPEPRRIDVDLRGITPGYFTTTGMRVQRGRALSDHDIVTSAAVAVVDETFARALTADGDVIGRRIRWIRQSDVEIEIVGIVNAVHHRGITEPARATVYRPIAQYPRTSMYLVARISGDPGAATERVLSAVAAINPLQPAADIATMDERVARATRRARMTLTLSSTLAILATLLAVVGIYGVLSFAVGQRQREFGVRLALGATPRAVRGLILREGWLLTAFGIGAGLLAASFVVRSASALLHGITPAALLPYVIGALIVALTSAAAFWLPAWRASMVSPLRALRQD